VSSPRFGADQAEPDDGDPREGQHQAPFASDSTIWRSAATMRETVRALDLADDVADTAGASVIDADFVILCVPVGRAR
jgi:hypothetical protein